MSRVGKTIKNARVGVIFYTLVLFAHFFSRSIFLEQLGDDFMGLVATLYSILGFLNLAELGVGTAIGFALYPHLFNNNHDEIKSITNLVGFLYKRIGLFILLLSVIVAIFFPIIFKDVSISLPIVYFAFFSFLLSSLLGYFINYRLVVLEADQKGYIIVKYFQTANILRLVFQSLLAYYYQSFVIWITLELLFTSCYATILHWRIKKEYPWLLETTKSIKKIPEHLKYLIQKIKQTFVHKIGAFVLGGTDQLLIFGLIDLKSVAFFGNYQLIFAQITNLLNNFFRGTGASVGNLVAENNQKNIDKVFWEMMALRYFIGGIISICIFFLLESFISIWVGKDYILETGILILMCCNFFISQIRVPVENFKNAYGLFSDTWAPIVEVILNLGFSLILGKMWGIFGIMAGTLISLSGIVVIWKPYYLYKYGFKRSNRSYWIGNARLLSSFLLTLIVIFYFIHLIPISQPNNFLDWILKALILTMITTVIYFPLLFILNKGGRDLTSRFLALVKSYLKNF